MGQDRDIDVGLGTVVAALAMIGAIARRSRRLFLVALAAASGEIVYRRWLARSDSNAARSLRGGEANGHQPDLQ